MNILSSLLTVVYQTAVLIRAITSSILPLGSLLVSKFHRYSSSFLGHNTISTRSVGDRIEKSPKMVLYSLIIYEIYHPIFSIQLFIPNLHALIVFISILLQILIILVRSCVCLLLIWSVFSLLAFWLIVFLLSYSLMSSG